MAGEGGREWNCQYEPSRVRTGRCSSAAGAGLTHGFRGNEVPGGGERTTSGRLGKGWGGTGSTADPGTWEPEERVFVGFHQCKAPSPILAPLKIARSL